MPEELDSYFNARAHELARGERLEAVASRMDADGVFARPDGEDVKIHPRGAAMSEGMLGAGEGVAQALVAREIAARLAPRDVDFTLAIGVGDALVCADYVVA